MLEPKQRFLAVRVGDRVAVAEGPQHWWIGDVIHAEGSARCRANSLFQIACVDSGVIRTVNADAVIDVLQEQASAAEADGSGQTQERSSRRTITPISSSEPARATNRAIVMGASNGAVDSGGLVFVYGSLKRGQREHRQLAGSHACGEAQLQGLALYDLGPFPMAIASDDPQAVLHGELYRVDPEQLARLDRFEGAPRLYERQRRHLADGRQVWVYVGQARQVRHVQRLKAGIWHGRAAQALLLVAAALQGLAGAGGDKALAGDLRQQCQAWMAAHGREQVMIANRIGQEQLLTKAHRFAEASPNDTTSLYSWSDIQRLCRRL